MRSHTKVALIAGLVLLVSAIQATPSDAQGRRPGRTRIHVGASFGYPFYGAFYDPFWDPFWMGAYRPWGWGPYYQGYPRPWADRDASSRTVGIRTDISPKETQIYVDGYYSGAASDFDGLFKRLRVPAGEHEIVLYLKGYRTVRQTLNLQPGNDYRVRQKMVALAAGETNEPPPSPPPQAAQPPDEPEAAGVGQPAPDEPRRRLPRPSPQPSAIEARGFGALSIRVQPAGSEILIDGERWQGPEGAGPLVVQVSEGPHQVEVRKNGFVTFSTEVQVRQGETSPLNVSLPEQR